MKQIYAYKESFYSFHFFLLVSNKYKELYFESNRDNFSKNNKWGST